MTDILESTHFVPLSIISPSSLDAMSCAAHGKPYSLNPLNPKPTVSDLGFGILTAIEIALIPGKGIGCIGGTADYQATSCSVAKDSGAKHEPNGSGVRAQPEVGS